MTDKKPKKLPDFFFCPTWKMNYYFCLGWKETDLIKYCKWRFDYTPEIGPAQTGKLFEFINGSEIIMLIWTRNKKDLSSLVHECVHAANFTLEIKGWKPDFNNDEPLTYLVQSIFDSAFKYTGVKLWPTKSGTYSILI